MGHKEARRIHWRNRVVAAMLTLLLAAASASASCCGGWVNVRIIRRNYTEVFGLPFYFIFVGEIKGFSEKNVREVFGQIKICGYMRIYSLRLKFFVGTIARHTHSYTIHLIRYISQVNSEYLACGGYTRSG